MGEIDVTKVTAVEYLEKLIKIDAGKHCEWFGCTECKYNNTACAEPSEIECIGIEEHISDVMMFETFDKPKIDWSKVEKDTLIEVSADGDKWYRRYFAKYEDEKVHAYMDGCTSKTTDATLSWKYARLADED